MTILKQKKNFVKREIRITNSVFFYKISKFGNETESDIPFEDLIGQKTSCKRSNNILLGLTIILYFLSLVIFIAKLKNADVEDTASLFWFIIATFSLIAYWFTREDLWKIKLTKNRSLFIYKNIPDREYVNNFYDTIMATRNSYLKKNYGEFDEFLNYENQLNNLKWLRTIEVITEEEFSKKYDELKKLIKPVKQNIGFENSN